MKPKALDLFCSGGGASMGYHQAGFDVCGVDIHPQPRYPFLFYHADALTFPLDGFDVVHASPPCQAHTSLKTMPTARAHEDLIPATRAKLQAWGGPYIIENVVGAPLFSPILLCGTMFGLGCDDAELRRHRLFESNLPLLVPDCQHGRQSRVIGVYGGHLRNRIRSPQQEDKGMADFTVEQGRMAMGISWMSLKELSQAIPPAYSHFIGGQVLHYLQQKVGSI